MSVSRSSFQRRAKVDVLFTAFGRERNTRTKTLMTAYNITDSIRLAIRGI